MASAQECSLGFLTLLTQLARNNDMSYLALQQLGTEGLRWHRV